MPTWATIILCTDGDVLSFESSWLEWSTNPQAWREKAKQQIEKKLRYLLRERELQTDAADVLDLIGNPSVLRDAACYMALALCAQNNTTHPEDAWAAKATHYVGLIDPELDQAAEMMQFDIDESGTIEDSEKYQVTGAVRFSRGGSPLNDPFMPPPLPEDWRREIP